MNPVRLNHIDQGINIGTDRWLLGMEEVVLAQDKDKDDDKSDDAKRKEDDTKRKKSKTQKKSTKDENEERRQSDNACFLENLTHNKHTKSKSKRLRDQITEARRLDRKKKDTPSLCHSHPPPGAPLGGNHRIHLYTLFSPSLSSFHFSLYHYNIIIFRTLGKNGVFLWIVDM